MNLFYLFDQNHQYLPLAAATAGLNGATNGAALTATVCYFIWYNFSNKFF
jgi:hypothetical protein